MTDLEHLRSTAKNDSSSTAFGSEKRSGSATVTLYSTLYPISPKPLKSFAGSNSLLNDLLLAPRHPPGGSTLGPQPLTVARVPPGRTRLYPGAVSLSALLKSRRKSCRSFAPVRRCAFKISTTSRQRDRSLSLRSRNRPIRARCSSGVK